MTGAHAVPDRVHHALCARERRALAAYVVAVFAGVGLVLGLGWVLGGRNHGRAKGQGRAIRLRRGQKRGRSPGSSTRKALVELLGKDPKSNSDIINGRAVERLASLIDPAKVIASGKSDPDAHYLDPTLLYPVTWEDKSMKDEIFGPILPILTYKSLDEALKRIAVTPRPLDPRAS